MDEAQEENEITTFSSPLRGYRAFLINTITPKAYSTGAGRLHWEPGSNHATCLVKDHPAPQTDCDCGLYALHHLQSAIHVSEKLAKSLVEDDVIYTCVALVAARGNVENHEQGFRAEEVIILAFLEDKENKELLHKVAEYYQVPVLSEKKIEEYLPQVQVMPDTKEITKEIIPASINQEEVPSILKKWSAISFVITTLLLYSVSLLATIPIIFISCMIAMFLSLIGAYKIVMVLEAENLKGYKRATSVKIASCVIGSLLASFPILFITALSL